MGREKVKSEGGSGGKRGHSNMVHWAYNHEIKDAARRKRRQCDDEQVEQGLDEIAEDSESSTKEPDLP
jgi:hypothetical protein